MSALSELDTRPSTLVDLVRPAVRAIPAYARDAEPTTEPPRHLRLDWNESPYGASPKARAALATFDQLHRYPDLAAGALRDSIARYAEAPTEQVTVGAGLDDVLKQLALLLIEPGDRVVISEPTFGVYRPLFALFGGEVIDAPLGEDFALKPERVLAAIDERTKIVLICNPNNPTGTLFKSSAVERIAAEAPCLVAIDEAYAEFAGVAHRPLMTRYPNVAIFRTLSKFAGLAGMRVGYGVWPESLIPFLPSVMPEFGNVGGAAAAAATASLDDLPYLREVTRTIVADRERLADDLRRLKGVEPVPSATNFLLVRLPREGAAVVAELADRGVFVRSFGRPELRDCLRVTVGTPEENAVFVQELTEVLWQAEESGTWA